MKPRQVKCTNTAEEGNNDVVVSVYGHHDVEWNKTRCPDENSICSDKPIMCFQDHLALEFMTANDRIARTLSDVPTYISTVIDHVRR